MPEMTLHDLRALRGRARSLLKGFDADLRPFMKRSDGTFRRKPDSRDVEDDINVTTTCSCLMGIAATHSFRDFYGEKSIETARERALTIFNRIVAAPWMSSGLADNNPFTTSLVLRAYGFLASDGLLPSLAADGEPGLRRPWETALPITDAIGLCKILCAHNDPASEFLWLSLTDQTRDRLNKWSTGSKDTVDAATQKDLTSDLRRIIESGWIYSPERFPASATAAKNVLAKSPSAYEITVFNRKLLSDKYPELIASPNILSLGEIARALAVSSKGFDINSYPAASTVIYWFVDGVRRANIRLEEGHWSELCGWATQEFNRKRSLVVSNHYAMMDPVAMGMAACLCARLRTLCVDGESGTTHKHLALLPSVIELDHAVEELLQSQAQSGIWPKYFPLFHYQDAGSNYCFAFELLEALLAEFGHESDSVVGGPTSASPRSKLMESRYFISAIDKALRWCEENRLRCKEGSGLYTGWNSGGQLTSLEKGYPESWATAVVHMFLTELKEVFDARIQQLVLERYRVSQPTTSLAGLLDIVVEFPDQPKSLRDTLQEKIVDNYRSLTPQSLRRSVPREPLSALLFGPPGTSKTEITKAVAADLGWPLLELSPSDFVQGSLDNVYLQAHQIFEDIMDLAGVVVFFDEMDALVQTRDDGHLDIASQFLTTMMLPSLAKLHDLGRVVFFMATNFQERFDPAIKRAGRFDLLLCMGPPSADEKVANLAKFLGKDPAKEEVEKATRFLREHFSRHAGSKDALDLFTYGEFKAFLKTLGDKRDFGRTIGRRLEELGDENFKSELERYSAHVTLRLADLTPLNQAVPERLADIYKLKFTLPPEEKKRTPIIRYLCDRRESRVQH